MNMPSHIERLKEKHASIERSILSEMKSPAPRAPLLHDLKSKKLALKEVMVRLQS